MLDDDFDQNCDFATTSADQNPQKAENVGFPSNPGFQPVDSQLLTVL